MRNYVKKSIASFQLLCVKDQTVLKSSYIKKTICCDVQGESRQERKIKYTLIFVQYSYKILEFITH